MPFNSETAKLWGKVGGKNNVKKNGVEHMSSIGLKGGEAMYNKHGREYYSRIGSIRPYRKDKLAAQKEKNGRT